MSHKTRSTILAAARELDDAAIDAFVEATNLDDDRERARLLNRRGRRWQRLAAKLRELAQGEISAPRRKA